MTAAMCGLNLQVAASKPWTVETHHLFPHAARARALAVWWAGVLLALAHELGHGPALLDPWMSRVMRFAVDRSTS